MIPSRPPNRPGGSPAVAATRRSGGDPPAGGAAAQTSGSTEGGGERSSGRAGSGGGEPDSPSWCRTKAGPPEAFHSRSTSQRPRRASSGYFSSDGDSLPSSPLSPRPAAGDGALLKHAQRVAEAQGAQHGRASSCSSSQHQMQTQEMQTQEMQAQEMQALEMQTQEMQTQEMQALEMQTQEMQTQEMQTQEMQAQEMQAQEMQAQEMGRELRRIGDDFNRLLLLRGMVAGRRRPVDHPNLQQEPTLLLCVGLLLLLIGRMVYLQAGTNSQDPAPV